MALALREGLWVEALVVSLYYWADATFVLVRRALRGEPVWRAHRQHAYQVAAAAGWRHDRVCWLIAGANAVLVAIAALDGRDILRLALAAIVVTGLLVFLRTRRAGAG